MLREIQNTNRRGSSNPTKRFNVGTLKKRLNRWREAAIKFSEVSDREYALIRKMVKENRKNLTKDEIKRVYQLLSKFHCIHFYIGRGLKDFSLTTGTRSIPTLRNNF